MRWGVLLVLGCGRLSFEPTSDALVGDATAPDAAFPTGPFGSAVALAALNDPVAAEDDPSMTGDQLELYFMSDRGGAGRAYVTTRASTTDPFGTPVLVDELNAGGSVNNTKVTTDGLAIYFSSNRAPSVGGDLWFSTRPDRSSPWGAPQHIPELASAVPDYEPCADQAQLVIYFTLNTAGELRVASRSTTTEPFGNVSPLPELDSPSYDGSLWIADSGLVVMFNSDRGGSRVLYQAFRASPSGPFGPIEPIPGVDSAAHEQDPWMSADGHTLLFVSNAAGTPDLYIATR